jgi:hypothetical protein
MRARHLPSMIHMYPGFQLILLLLLRHFSHSPPLQLDLLANDAVLMDDASDSGRGGRVVLMKWRSAAGNVLHDWQGVMCIDHSRGHIRTSRCWVGEEEGVDSLLLYVTGHCKTVVSSSIMHAEHRSLCFLIILAHRTLISAPSIGQCPSVDAVSQSNASDRSLSWIRCEIIIYRLPINVAMTGGRIPPSLKSVD